MYSLANTYDSNTIFRKIVFCIYLFLDYIVGASNNGLQDADTICNIYIQAPHFVMRMPTMRGVQSYHVKCTRQDTSVWCLFKIDIHPHFVLKYFFINNVSSNSLYKCLQNTDDNVSPIEMFMLNIIMFHNTMYTDA